MAATMETIFVDRRACAWELRKVVFVSIVKIVSNVIFLILLWSIAYTVTVDFNSAIHYSYLT